VFSVSIVRRLSIWIYPGTKKQLIKGNNNYLIAIEKVIHQLSRLTSINDIDRLLNSNLLHPIDANFIKLLVPEKRQSSEESVAFRCVSNSQFTIAFTSYEVKQLRDCPSFGLTNDWAHHRCGKLDHITGIIPCVHNEQLIGIVIVGTKVSAQTFNQKALDMFLLLGDQIAIVLERLRQVRREAELSIAERIQTGIVPQAPSVPNIELKCVTMASSSLGGDYYDVISTPRGTWILIGDVTGHGVGAARVMFMIQSIITTLIHTIDTITPSDLLFKANTILCQHMVRFTESLPSTILAIFTENGRDFEFSGYQEPIHIFRKSSWNIDVIPVDQIPLGIGFVEDLPVGDFKTNSFTLSTGDLLYVGTDGITEAPKHGDDTAGQFGPHGVNDFLIENATESVANIALKLQETIKSYSNNTLHDDMTFIVLRACE